MKALVACRHQRWIGCEVLRNELEAVSGQIRSCSNDTQGEVYISAMTLERVILDGAAVLVGMCTETGAVLEETDQQ